MNAYRPRDPTQTLIYRVIQDHWKTFVQERESEGRFLPAHVMREFDAFIACGVLANGFVRLKCESCRHEKLVAFSCKRRGFCSSCGARRMSEQAAFLTDWVLPDVPVRQWVVSFPIQLRYWMARDSKLLTTVLAIVMRVIRGSQRKRADSARGAGFKSGESGSVTLIQRFGGSANLNIHFHSLMIEGVYGATAGGVRFLKLSPPSNEEVQSALELIQSRVVRALRRRGYLPENDSGDDSDAPVEPALEPALPALDQVCQAASVQSKIALGENSGQRVRKVGSFGLAGESALQVGKRCASLGGFSLHANTAIDAGEKDRLEKLCRYVARPPVAEMRLNEVPNGDIIYWFKQAWGDGTQAVRFTPLEFIEKLVALIPPPRIHLTRYHGVLAPNHRLRRHVVPAPPSVSANSDATQPDQDKEVFSQKPRDPRRLTWSELLKRVFQVDLSACPDCGGALKFIAAILDRKIIIKILAHLGLPSELPQFKPARAPPQQRLWDEFLA